MNLSSVALFFFAKTDLEFQPTAPVFVSYSQSYDG